jgi:hypothetical protein
MDDSSLLQEAKRKTATNNVATKTNKRLTVGLRMAKPPGPVDSARPGQHTPYPGTVKEKARQCPVKELVARRRCRRFRSPMIGHLPFRVNQFGPKTGEFSKFFGGSGVSVFAVCSCNVPWWAFGL